MDFQSIAKALEEFSADVLAKAPVSTAVSVKTQERGFPQTTAEPAQPVASPLWTGRYEVVVTPQGDVRKEDAKQVRFDGARHLQKMIEHDPTLGNLVTGHEAIRTEFNEKTGVVEVAATIDEP